MKPSNLFAIVALSLASTVGATESDIDRDILYSAPSLQPAAGNAANDIDRDILYQADVQYPTHRVVHLESSGEYDIDRDLLY